MGNFYLDKSVADIDGARYTYRIDDCGSACIEQCKSSCRCIRIPETFDGYPVTAIGESAFSTLSCVENVYCPCALRHIGRHAFEGCLKLQSVQLNDGLRSIDEEAFFLCTSLGELCVPSSVERFGPRPLGPIHRSSLRKSSGFQVRFDPSNTRLFFDELGVLYEHVEGGLILVDGYRFEGAHLDCKADTIEIGPRALSGMPSLESVLLPYGLTRIGDEAFRGSTKLSQANLPESLESIGDAAFSSTSLKSLRIPAKCTDISLSAFTLGSISDNGEALLYNSRLDTVEVDDKNPVFCVRDGMICKRLENGRLETLLAPASLDEAHLDESVELVRSTTFAGTKTISLLALNDGVLFESPGGHLAHCDIGTIQITAPRSYGQTLSLQMPEGSDGRVVVSKGICGQSFDVRSFVTAYDETLSLMSCGIDQARLVLKRLADARGIDGDAKRLFERFIENQLVALCLNFGARGEFEMFEAMADAGVISPENVSALSEVLSQHGDAEAVGYLLDMKQRRFGKASWDDYEL